MKNLLLGLYEPKEGYKVAIINDGGVPVKFVETRLSEETLWKMADFLFMGGLFLLFIATLLFAFNIIG